MHEKTHALNFLSCIVLKKNKNLNSDRMNSDSLMSCLHLVSEGRFLHVFVPLIRTCSNDGKKIKIEILSNH